jgi:hypothetical protein
MKGKALEIGRWERWPTVLQNNSVQTTYEHRKALLSLTTRIQRGVQSELDAPVPWLAMASLRHSLAYALAAGNLWRRLLTKGMDTGCSETTTSYRRMNTTTFLMRHMILLNTTNTPYASLHTGSSQMASAAAMARARIYCCGITSRTIACVPATLLLRTRLCRAVEVMLIPDIITALNGPTFVHGARWSGFEETTWREGEDLRMELCFAHHEPRRSTILLLPRLCYGHSAAVPHFAGKGREVI